MLIVAAGSGRSAASHYRLPSPRWSPDVTILGRDARVSCWAVVRAWQLPADRSGDARAACQLARMLSPGCSS